MKKSSAVKQPTLLVFAGPNGSGKSLITRKFEIKGLYINADEIKRQDNSLSDLDAAVEAETLREHCLHEMEDFSFETVLSTDRNLDLIARAKEAGYFVDCVFVLTADPEINIFRVKTRVLKGGHDVPVDKTRSRYKKSLENIPSLVALCDRIRIFDNSDEPFIIYIKNTDGSEIISKNNYWSIRKIIALTKADND